MQPVIRFENVGKLYRLGTVGTGTLSHDLRRWWITSVMRREDPYLKIGETNDRSTKGSSDYVYALRDINLEVNEGDVLGIIGKNGAGKSTLLKLLSRVTAPTTGKIYTRGRIASLLEVGTGFHPELTGRENIYMNGCILGMKRHEIDKKLDEIVDFSGCERYIDTPVKRYSSGMMVRLGFAVAAHLDPEILVVDEVLAVGDAEFQKKAIGKMQDVSRGQGRTVLFVSHNMGSIKALCRSGLLLENGATRYYGEISQTISEYLTDNLKYETDSFNDRKDRFGVGGIRINRISITTMDNMEISQVLSGQDFKLRCFYESSYKESQKNVILSIKLSDENDIGLSLIHNRLTAQPFTVQEGSGIFEFIVKKNPLNTGIYSVSYTIMGLNGTLPYLDGINNALKLKVIEGDFYNSGELAPHSFGPILIDASFKNIQ